jgi:hypothetical protein
VLTACDHENGEQLELPPDGHMSDLARPRAIQSLKGFLMELGQKTGLMPVSLMLGQGLKPVNKMVVKVLRPVYPDLRIFNSPMTYAREAHVNSMLENLVGRCMDEALGLA